MTISAGVFRQLVASTSISLSLLVVGTAIGWPSPVILAIETSGEPFNMTHDEIAIMVSAVYFGNMISAIPSGILMDNIGRKNTLHYMTVVPILSWLLVYFAKSALILHLSRFLMGIYFGAVGTIVPMYVAEISEPNVRGAFSTLFQFMTNLGLLIVFLVGSFMNYFTLTFVLGIIPIILAVILTFMPESPYWYVKRGRHEDAVRALSWLRCNRPEVVKEELTRIEDAVTKETRSGSSCKELLRTRGNQKALFTVQVLAITQRSSGISSLLAYSSTTLPSGFEMLTPTVCVTAMGIVMTSIVFLSTFLVDKYGRRPLLTISSVGSGLAMFIAGTWFFMDTNTGIYTKETRSGSSYKELLRTRGNRKAQFTVQVLAITQIASGISSLLAYSSTTLPSGFEMLTPNVCVTAMGIVLTCSVFLSTFLVDKYGRRPLLTISSIGSGLAMFIAGSWFFMDTNTDWDVKEYNWVPFGSVLAYGVFFSIGLGPLATTIQGEMFPSNTKSLASGITAIVAAMTSFSMNMVYHRLADDWGMFVNYWIFSVSALIAALFTNTGLVETKGKTLQEIQRELNKVPSSGQI